MSMRWQTTRPIAISGAYDRTIRVWDLDAGQPLGGPLVHDPFVNAVTVGELQARSLVASSGAEETVRPDVATALPDSGREAALTLGPRRENKVPVAATALVAGTDRLGRVDAGILASQRQATREQ